MTLELFTSRWRAAALVLLAALLLAAAALQPKDAAGQSEPLGLAQTFFSSTPITDFCYQFWYNDSGPTTYCGPTTHNAFTNTGDAANFRAVLSSAYRMSSYPVCTSLNYDTPPTYTVSPDSPPVLRVAPREGETVSCTYLFSQRPVVIEKEFLDRIPSNDDLPTLSGLPQDATFD